MHRLVGSNPDGQKAELWPTAVDANREHIESFDVTIIENVGHFLMLEKPVLFNRELRRVIKFAL